MISNAMISEISLRVIQDLGNDAFMHAGRSTVMAGRLLSSEALPANRLLQRSFTAVVRSIPAGTRRKELEKQKHINRCALAGVACIVPAVKPLLNHSEPV